MNLFKRLCRILHLSVPAATRPWAPLSTDAERAIVVDVLYRNAGVRAPDAREVDAIAIAARRYVLAIQRHDDELVDVREASAVEGRLRSRLHDTIGDVHGIRMTLIPIVGHEIARRFSGLDAG